MKKDEKKSRKKILKKEEMIKEKEGEIAKVKNFCQSTFTPIS